MVLTLFFPQSHFISALTVVFVNSKSLSSLKIDDTPVDDPSLKVLVANNSDTLKLLKMSSCPHVSPAGTVGTNSSFSPLGSGCVFKGGSCLFNIQKIWKFGLIIGLSGNVYFPVVFLVPVTNMLYGDVWCYFRRNMRITVFTRGQYSIFRATHQQEHAKTNTAIKKSCLELI